MIIQALQYELSKFGTKKALILFATITFLIVIFFVATPKNNSNNYYDDLMEWSDSIKLLKYTTIKLSPNQQVIFDQYSKRISHKLSLLEQYDANDIINSYNVCNRVDEIKAFHNIAQILFAVFLAIVFIGREQSSGEINQALIMPWKRSSLYIAKLLLATLTLFIFALMCFGVSYITSIFYANNHIVIDYVFINQEGQCSVIKFGLYYFIQFLLAIVPALSVYLFLTMLLVITKKNALSVIVLMLLFAGFWIFSYVGEYMGYFWYNLFPTKSFTIEEYIFTGTIINEVDTFNEQMKFVVGHQFNVLTILFYDVYILLALLWLGIDRFKANDYS